MLDVVPVIDEVRGDPIEQRGVPGLPVHFVGVRNDAVAEETLPDAIDERPGEAPVARVGEDCRDRGAARIERSRRGRAAQLRIKKTGVRILIQRAIAPEQLQLGLGREVTGQRVRVLQLPMADETVVARVALQIDAEENLRRVLRCLHPRHHGSARLAPPVHTDQEPVGIARRLGVEQLRDEPVVRKVRFERRAQPGRDALSTRRLRVVRDAVFIAQQIVPERDPVLRVALIVSEQRPHEAFALLWTAVLEKCLQRIRRRQQAPQIEIRAPRKQPIGYELWFRGHALR